MATVSPMNRKSKAATPGRQAVAYYRVSSKEQAEKDLSIPAQKRAVREWAAREGRPLVKEFVEPGDSARDDGRPEFRKMIGELLDGSIVADTIVVTHTSRFMRNTEASFVYRRKLEKKGVRVVSVTQPTDDGPSGKLMETIFAAFDQYESDMNAYRTMAAMQQNAREGNFNGSSAPFGFQVAKVMVGKNERGRLVKHPDESNIARMLFGLWIDGRGAKAVAAELNRRGVEHRGRMWTKDDVLRVIEEEASAGTYYWGKWDTVGRQLRDKSEWIPIEVEGFVERDVFDLAQSIRERRNPKKVPGRTASSPLLLAGLIKCGKCGASFTKETSGKVFAGEHPHAYYNCRTFTRIGKGKCAGRRVRVNVLDRLVLDHLSDKLFSTERCRALAEALVDKSGVLRRKTDDRRTSLRSQLDQIERRITRWEATFESGTQDMDVVAPRLRELREEQAKVSEMLTNLKPLDAPPKHLLDADTIAQFQALIRDIFVSADTPATKNYLNFLIEQIVVHADRVEIKSKPLNALALMAAAPGLRLGDVNHPEAVLTKGGDWLRK